MLVKVYGDDDDDGADDDSDDGGGDDDDDDDDDEGDGEDSHSKFLNLPLDFLLYFF